MIPGQKEKEYKLMQTSAKGAIMVQIPNGPLISCQGWDYATDLKKTSFKTDAEIKVKHPLLLIEEIDLFPVNKTKVYKVTVLRQPESNLKK